eukprot:TRINITY_DN9042_c0_g1_i4.p1 TRINITY_DN9042_c0_g1~~TRINITY_DN9042_c0_g1_i4.p1  ORF type:complete len:427 (+),score=95.31 TRINITY_DN9042_c0_g1_i4:279-1559(+)
MMAIELPTTQRAWSWIKDFLMAPDSIKALLHRIQADVKSKSNLVRGHTWRLRRYPCCFVGKQFVAWLIQERHARSEDEAVEIGQLLTMTIGCFDLPLQLLMMSGAIHHVVDEHEFKNEHLFYRFIEDEPQVLNTTIFTQLQECMCHGWLAYGQAAGAEYTAYGIIPKLQDGLYFYANDIAVLYMSVLSFEDTIEATLRVVEERTVELLIAYLSDDVKRLQLTFASKRVRQHWTAVLVEAGFSLRHSPEVPRQLALNLDDEDENPPRTDIHTPAENAAHRQDRLTEDELLQLKMHPDDLVRMQQLLTILDHRAQRYASTRPALLLKDTPALIATLHKHLELKSQRWLGMTFHDGFRGSGVLACMQQLAQTEQAQCVPAATHLCDIGAYHHTFRSFKFSTSCFFFWAEAIDLNRVIIDEELKRYHTLL